MGDASVAIDDTAQSGTSFSSFLGDKVIPLFKDAVTAAKDKAAANIAESLSKNAGVQAQIKTASGNKLGNWILDNWKVLAIGAVVVIGAVLFIRRR